MKPPVETLYGAPAVSDLRLSPDGTRVAYLAPVDGVPNVWLAELDLTRARPLTRERTALSAPRWTSDGRGLLVLRDGDGDELHHVWSVDGTSGELRDLTPYDGVQAQLVRISSARPRHVAIALNLEDRARHDLYVLDLDSGDLDGPVASGAHRYAVDDQLRVRLSIVLRPDGSAEVHGPKGLLETIEPADTVPLILGDVTTTADGSAGYLLTSAREATVALVRYDLLTGARAVVHRDPVFDVAGFSVSPVNGEVDLVCVDGWRRTWHGEDEALLDAAGSDVHELQRSHDDRTWLVRKVRDSSAPTWELVRPEARLIASERPELDAYRLGVTEDLAFTARDGRPIRGYVTWPPDRSRERLPAVLWVHGGPWSRDRWGFDPIVQLLATRGYAVVQVNYRGSTGYGKEHLDAGDRQWGRLMQTDLADALDVVPGLDRDRVAIAGGSYGGYAALMGLVTDPDRYACGIAWCAPSNLLTLLRSFPPYWEALLAVWHSRVGHPEQDAEELRDRSPLTHLDRLRAPLLLVHGANDPRVLAEESRAVAAALGERCDYHEIEGEGHGFTQPANQIWMLKRMEAFLAEHL